MKKFKINRRRAYLNRGLLIIMFISGLSHVWSQQPQPPKAPKAEVSGSNTLVVDEDPKVDETLSYINNLLDAYNIYDSSLSINLYSGDIIFKDKFSVFSGKFAEVEFRRNGESMGIFCKNGSDCLRQQDLETGESMPDAEKYTFGIKKGGKAVEGTDQAIERLNRMLSILSGGKHNISTVSAAIKDNLRVINRAYANYNKYQTVFSVEGDNLRWVSSVADVTVPLNNVTFYINYSNNWMVLKCISGECFSGSSSYLEEYSMSLETQDPKIAPNIEDVLQAFNNIRREVLGSR